MICQISSDDKGTRKKSVATNEASFLPVRCGRVHLTHTSALCLVLSRVVASPLTLVIAIAGIRMPPKVALAIGWSQFLNVLANVSVIHAPFRARIGRWRGRGRTARVIFVATNETSFLPVPVCGVQLAYAPALSLVLSRVEASHPTLVIAITVNMLPEIPAYAIR